MKCSQIPSGISQLSMPHRYYGSNPLFILNAVGYLVLIVALYFIPQLAGQRALIRWVLLGYTAVTFVLYFVFNWPDVWGPAGLFDKAVELVLMILLWLDRNDP